MFRNILVPTDGSTLSRRAAKMAVQFAKEQGAKVTAIHVVPAYQPNIIEDYSAKTFISSQQYLVRAKAEAARVLDSVKNAAVAADVPYAGSYATSDFPYVEIVRAAQRNKCDLIIMASHGRRGLSRLILGSETSKVLAHSKIPVLVVR